MKRTLATISIFLILGIKQTNAQILNVEAIRKESDTMRWSGFAQASVSLTKNKNKRTALKARTRLQHRYENLVFIYLNDFGYRKLNDRIITNRGTAHFRLNYLHSSQLTWEGFTQLQYDDIKEIDFRYLLGAGPRIKLYGSENYIFNLGLLAMYEYERIDSSLEDATHKDIRKSTYLAFRLFPKDGLSIVSTTYYQPLFKDFSDYRMFNETAMHFKIFEKLSFRVGFEYLFDEKPALGVPKNQYKLTNGLTYSFK